MTAELLHHSLSVTVHSGAEENEMVYKIYTRIIDTHRQLFHVLVLKSRVLQAFH